MLSLSSRQLRKRIGHSRPFPGSGGTACFPFRPAKQSRAAPPGTHAVDQIRCFGTACGNIDLVPGVLQVKSGDICQIAVVFHNKMRFTGSMPPSFSDLCPKRNCVLGRFIPCGKGRRAVRQHTGRLCTGRNFRRWPCRGSTSLPGLKVPVHGIIRNLYKTNKYSITRVFFLSNKRGKSGGLSVNFPVRLSPGHIVSILFSRKNTKTGYFVILDCEKGNMRFIMRKGI